MGVTSIANNAFYRCSGLTSITIPAGVTSIDGAAFFGCSGLTGITIPSSVISIGSSAFSGCSGLTSITIPVGVTSIGTNAFLGCSGLASITIPASVTSIGTSVFSGCRGLTIITIPTSVTSIGASAFSGCIGLASITIPASVTSIGESAFIGCGGLTSIVIPDSVTSLGFDVFRGCSNLENVTIGNGVSAVNNSAFSGLSNLEKITIGSGVTSIGDKAFYNCRNLTTVFFKGDAPSLTGGSHFLLSENSIVYYLPGRSGWSSVYATINALLWAVPAISNQPDPIVANTGESVAFEVGLNPSVTLTPSFQWYRNGIAIGGANNPILFLDNINSANAGIYKVVASNVAGSVESSTATLTVSTSGGNLYTQEQYNASLILGYNLGFSAGKSSVTDNPNSFGLYTLSQVQTIYIDTPLLTRDLTNGKFKLTVKAMKSTNLLSYETLNFASGNLMINSLGEIEFVFSSGDSAAFFRLQAK